MKKLLVSLAMLPLFGCAGSTPETAQKSATRDIPITSKSPEAVDHFQKGRTLFENQRPAEAAAEFDQALKLDTDFALARAMHGVVTPGGDGLKELEQAATQASSLPEPERVYIEALLVGREGDVAKNTHTWTRLTEVAPDDWHAHQGLGMALFFQMKDAEAAAAFQKAISLSPQAGSAINMLGYAYLRQGKANEAIDAFKRYVSAMPNEPNPQDSLAEALMAGGQLTEAEAGFRKAAEMSPQFWQAWEGAAYAKFFAGDWAGGREALAKSRQAAPRPVDRMASDEMSAWASLAERKIPEALKKLDAAEKSADALPANVANINLDRAVIMLDGARYRDALTAISSALTLADNGKLPPFATRNTRQLGLALRAAAEGKMGDAAAAQKTVAALEQESSTRPEDPQLQSSLHLARGMLALAQSDAADAKAHFAQCLSIDAFCRWQEVIAAEKAGDKAGADAARAELLRVYRRDPVYLYVRSRLAKPAAPRTTS
jgi:tetratricopeptide (TPR) repeat protein